MTFEEKMKALEESLFNMCTENDSCNGCPFDDDENAYMDEKIGMCSCGLRDCFGKFPHQPGWDIKTALGLEEPYRPVFPEAVEESIMRHFTGVE